jgi:hypothetical protein
MKPGVSLHRIGVLPSGKFLNKGKRPGARLHAGDDFEQPLIPRRIEKMRNEEIPREALGKTFDQSGKRDCRCIRRNHSARPPHLIDPLVEGALGIRSLDDRLDDPVAIGDLAHVVGDVAGRNERDISLVHQGRRLSSRQAFDGTGGYAAAVAVIGRGDVEQHHRNARVCHMRSDARTHHARPENGHLADGVHSSASSTVAIP